MFQKCDSSKRHWNSMVAPFSKIYRKIWVGFCLNAGKRSMYQRPKFPCSYFLKALEFYLTLLFLCEYPEVISETSATIIYVMMIKRFFAKWFTNKSPLNFLFLQPNSLSVVITITNLWHTARRIWTDVSVRSDFVGSSCDNSHITYLFLSNVLTLH